ncbi:Mediator of RNA polymerase II transcription subunit 23 [Folsomia candida]|uniref:Mediator of RNA polymerase II transcription subunit 23 n=1 Tax=Folsomia candida TaxID=158441 RepID=A0A226EP11_FOLCA|nr:Mediator of RNA polymerase II transcription subunit 23 [Folsomia candida]
MQANPSVSSVVSSTATPNPVIVDTVDQVKVALKDFTELRCLSSAFNAFMVHDASVYEELVSSMYERIAKIFKETSNQESLENGVKHIVSVASGHTNEETVQVMISILEQLVSNSVVTARLVCESLLNNDRMVFKNSKFWIKSFVLIRKIIGRVDYKGVREIMKTCLDKIGMFRFPDQVPPSTLPQLNAIIRLLQHIFDRSACLLPAYFIVNEILKNYPDNRNYPPHELSKLPSQHWSVSLLMSQLVDSFKPTVLNPTAQIVTIIGRSRMLPVVEHSGHAGYLIMSWKLDPTTLRFMLKGSLPYDKELLKPQDRLLRYILEQPYSRDMACAILGLQKQHKLRCSALEERLVELILAAMERTEAEMGQTSDGQSGSDEALPSTLSLWQHLSTQVIFFVLFQFASFPHIVTNLYIKISDVKLFKGRDFLMWILLQFISGSIQKNPLSDFLPVLRLYDVLYPEKDPLPVPDMTKPVATAQLSATCIWIHILKKAQGENQTLPRPLPSTLKTQYDYLQSLVQPSSSQIPLQVNDYRVALLCNAYSTNQEHFSRPMAALVEAIHGSSTGTLTATQSPTTPLSVQTLDSLTVHTKMSLIHNIVTHIMKVAQSKLNQNLAPALIETYARLLVYMEIESLGIKGFISQLLPAVYKSQAWGILHTLLEMFCYRLHHIQPHYRVQLLTHLHSLATNSHTSSAQLHLCVEMTSLRLITGFNSVEVMTQLSRVIGETKSLVSTESEELNRALVLTIARAIHVTGADGVASGTWFKEILNAIMQNTPHNWSTHTLQCFPPVLAEYFQQNQVPKENKQQLKNMVEEEYRNWNAMISNEHELIEHFSMQGNPALFLCIVWKMLIEAISETERINPLVFKVIERIGPKGLSGHLRKFCDYIICEFGAHRSATPQGSNVVILKLVDSIMEMVWKYNIVPFDRFILCMALRTNEGNDAQMCYFMMNLLMFKNAEFQNRVSEFIQENSPEHWKQKNWHEKHKSYHLKYPEVFLFEDQQQNQLPVYFGNVCVRFLPVLDILIHRFLEINSDKSIEMTLLRMDRPITYLYNTFHYYETRLRDKPLLKRKLVSSIMGSLGDAKPPNFALTEHYNNYVATNTDDVNWTPEISYYAALISRFVDVIEGKKRFFSVVDWRYNEFPNPAAHVLHCTCIEIMAIPVVPSLAGSAILDVVMLGRAMMNSKESSIEDMEAWMNATGLILVSLPDPYWLMLHDRLVSTVEIGLQTWSHNCSPLTLFNFKATFNGLLFNEYANLLAITHAVWHHLGSGHLHHIQNLVTERILPILTNEVQLLFVCHLVAPFLQRFNGEKPAMVCRLTIALYELLEKVDKSTPLETPLVYMDVFCDLLYHIKYMFTGDIVKTEVEAKIRCLRPVLQLRLRFITHLNIEDIATHSSSSLSLTSNNQSQQQQLPQYPPISSSTQQPIPTMMEV